jgi:DNA adenine methylase
MPDYLEAYCGRLAPVASRLAGVSLENLPAIEIVKRYGRHSTCLIYADPPYLDNVRASGGKGDSYRHEMRYERDHRELAAALVEARAAVVLSGYDSPLYAELYDGWHRTEIAGFTGNGRTGGAKRTEVLWSNRPFSRATLFDGLEAG